MKRGFPPSRFLEHLGKRQSLSAWARELGLSKGAIFQRIKRGWTVERALSTPLGANYRRHEP
jgi:hypothetical protein